MFRKIGCCLVLALTLAGCGSGGHQVHTPPAGPGWNIGPVINGKNYSMGMPAYPTADGAGWRFAFSTLPTDHVDYVQGRGVIASLVGVKQVVMHYDVTGSGFVPHGVTDGRPATVGLCFQRRGDNWSGAGAFQSYRWYSRQLPELKAGNYTLTVSLTLQSLGDVYGKSDNQAALDATLADLDNIAVVFGNTSGAGHGVYATAPAQFKMVSLEFVR